jgi:hypothetical protein
VPGDGEQIDVELAHVDAQLADRLRRVGVHESASGMGAAGDLRDGLNNARLVVGMHDGDQRRADDRFAQRAFVDAPVLSDADGTDRSIACHRGAWFASRRMFDRGDHDGAGAGPRRADNGEVTRLGSPRGEHDLVGLGANQVRHLASGALDRIVRALAIDVRARRISPRAFHRIEHRSANFRMDGSRRVVIEKYRVHHHDPVSASGFHTAYDNEFHSKCFACDHRSAREARGTFAT